MTGNWITRFPVASGNAPYYEREVAKTLGTIYSILGDYSALRREHYLQLAESYLDRCARLLHGENPSALDHNNLADLYRQLDKCKEAQREIDLAFREKPDVLDPTFVQTQAMIFWRQKQPLRALLETQRYGEDHAEHADSDDMDQFIQNQILGARLAANIEADHNDSYLGLASKLLEKARAFVSRKFEPNSKTAIRLSTIDELLGFAYFELPGQEALSVKAFERIQEALAGVAVPPTIEWRRKLGLAKAQTRLARAERRRYSAETSRLYWLAAKNVLQDSARVVNEHFSLASDVELPFPARNFRFSLDTVIADQDLSEESFWQGQGDDSKNLADQGATISLRLQACLEPDAPLRGVLEKDLEEMRSQLRMCEAQHAFLEGRLLVRNDPTLTGAGLIETVRAKFDSARGLTGELDCRIDLSFGELLLHAAVAGKRDATVNYAEAIAALERANSRGVPSLRVETVRMLVDA